MQLVIQIMFNVRSSYILCLGQLEAFLLFRNKVIRQTYDICSNLKVTESSYRLNVECLPGCCTNLESSEWCHPLESDSSSESVNNDTSSPSKMSSSDNANENPHWTEKESDNISKPSSTEANIQYYSEGYISDSEVHYCSQDTTPYFKKRKNEFELLRNCWCTN